MNTDYEAGLYRALFYHLFETLGIDDSEPFRAELRPTITECGVCFHHYHVRREHCPTCGARRVFLGNHSFAPTSCSVMYRNAGREIVRAIRSDFAFAVNSVN